MTELLVQWRVATMAILIFSLPGELICDWSGNEPTYRPESCRKIKSIIQLLLSCWWQGRPSELCWCDNWWLFTLLQGWTKSKNSNHSWFWSLSPFDKLPWLPLRPIKQYYWSKIHSRTSSNSKFSENDLNMTLKWHKNELWKSNDVANRTFSNDFKDVFTQALWKVRWLSGVSKRVS